MYEAASDQEFATKLAPAALIVPSVALPGTSNLVIFGTRVRSRYGVQPFDRDVDVPCDPVVDVGTPVVDLLSHVRWRGTRESGYEAWKRGPGATVATERRSAAGPGVVDRPTSKSVTCLPTPPWAHRVIEGLSGSSLMIQDYGLSEDTPRW